MHNNGASLFSDQGRAVLLSCLDWLGICFLHSGAYSLSSGFSHYLLHDCILQYSLSKFNVTEWMMLWRSVWLIEVGIMCWHHNNSMNIMPAPSHALQVSGMKEHSLAYWF